jgi:hypothetical protein
MHCGSGSWALAVAGLVTQAGAGALWELVGSKYEYLGVVRR